MIVNKLIIESCKKKQEEGYRALYKICLPYVFAVVKRYIYNEEARKDTVQEAFAQIFLNINKFSSARGGFKPWVRKIVVNQCLMYLRKERKLKLLVPLDAIDENKYSEEIRFDALSISMIETLLSKMPEGYKTIFLLVVIDGFSHAEVGEMLQISKETSRSQLSRAKTWLKNKLFQHPKFKANGYF